MSTYQDTERRFRRAFDDFSGNVLAYALRHAEPDTAKDVVGEVFLVAWRRVDDMPTDPLPWLLVIARNTLANERRSARRRGQLLSRLGQIAAIRETPTRSTEERVIERSVMLSALADLTELEREAVLLVAWDGLAASAAAQVAGCSRRAFDVRLHRARRRLERSCVSSSLAGTPTSAHVPREA